MSDWGNVPIPDSETVFWSVGPRRIWVRREEKTILLATEKKDAAEENADESAEESPSPPEDAEWKRFVLRKKVGSVQIMPVMSKLNVVVRSKAPFSLMPGTQTYLFVSIPTLVCVSAGKLEEDALLLEPTVALTKTWFGDPAGGELCRGLRMPVLFEVTPENFPAHRVVCPIRVKNTSKTRLAFSRLCVHVNHLKIFQGQEYLWTNEVHVTFCGDEAPSRISNEAGAPSFDKTAKLLTDSRVPTNRSLLRTSFESLKLLDGWKWSPFSS